MDKDQLEIMAELVAGKVAKKVLEEHKKDCPVNDIKKDLYGNGNAGIKYRLSRVEWLLGITNNTRRWILDRIIGPVIAAIVVSGIFMLFR